ncbi:MAG TPA: hypothetical protein VGP82_19270 [Ktedonobacterales bacterium]|nr:hypothetical protein [Ktedonobacterales bacterium]
MLAWQTGRGADDRRNWMRPRAFLSDALDQEPHASGFPVKLWRLRDLQTLLVRERGERGVQVSMATRSRVVHSLGYNSRRPRQLCHDLIHRQDVAAVAAAKQVLDWWQKNACSARRSASGLRGRREVQTPPYLAQSWRRNETAAEGAGGRGGSAIRGVRCRQSTRVDG